MEHDDITARLARLEARRPSTATTQGKRRHPAHRARIATTVMTIAAMVGTTAYMAVNDHTATAASVGVTNTANVSNALTSSGSTTATPAAVAKQAVTVTKGS